MKSAKEMFSELGFNREERKRSIIYIHVDLLEFKIYFDKFEKGYRFPQPYTINMSVNGAIQQQIKELGWEDEGEI